MMPVGAGCLRRYDFRTEPVSVDPPVYSLDFE